MAAPDSPQPPTIASVRIGAQVTPMPGITLLPPMSRFILQGGPASLRAASQAWPAAFSTSACRAITASTCASLWLGPDEYLLLDSAAEDASAWFTRLEAAIGNEPHSLVDVSHRQCALELQSADAAALLNTGCPLDLHLSAFPVGMCTRTVFAKADIVLWRRGEHRFHVEVWRSFMDYMGGCLREALIEFA